MSNDKNEGAAYSRNRALNFASGQVIAFIDSDDFWHPKKLEMQLKFMESGHNFTFTSFEVVNERGVSTGKIIDSVNKGPYNYTDMLRKKATLGCSTVMITASILRDLRMPNLETGQDYAFWLQILKKNSINASLLNHPYTSYRKHAHSLSRNKFKKAVRQWSIYRNSEKLGILYSLFYFIWYVKNALFR